MIHWLSTIVASLEKIFQVKVRFLSSLFLPHDTLQTGKYLIKWFLIFKYPSIDSIPSFQRFFSNFRTGTNSQSEERNLIALNLHFSLTELSSLFLPPNPLSINPSSIFPKFSAKMRGQVGNQGGCEKYKWRLIILSAMWNRGNHFVFSFARDEQIISRGYGLRRNSCKPTISNE